MKGRRDVEWFQINFWFEDIKLNNLSRGHASFVIDDVLKNGIDVLVLRWQKCIKVDEDYFNKQKISFKFISNFNWKNDHFTCSNLIILQIFCGKLE